MDSIWIRTLFLLCLLSPPCLGEVDLTKLEGWKIVIRPGASAAERYAAEEFQRYFEQSTGRLLPMGVTQARGEKGHIVIGVSTARKSREVSLPWQPKTRSKSLTMDDEEFWIDVSSHQIGIMGGSPRGALYGVYSFLEDELGVRFLTTDHTHVPRLTTSKVLTPGTRRYKPPLSFRYAYFGENHKDHAFAVRLRNNAFIQDEKLGGATGEILINHTFASQVPERVYGKEHPEYFAEVDGKRLNDTGDDMYRSQLCLTNPDVLKIVTESVLKELAAHPGMKNISVSQNDNKKYCQCSQCRKIDEREGSPMGSLLTFVNAVADRVAEKHPGVKVGTLAYQYSRKPPRTVRPRSNVHIQLCSIEACMIHPLNDPQCPNNVAFQRDAEGWGRISRQTAFWNYNINFHRWPLTGPNYLLPCPNLDVIEPNVRFFISNQAKGLFMQAAGDTVSAEFSDLRNYMICRMMWNPHQNVKTLRDEFIRLHYGAAAEEIREYLDFIHDHARKSGKHHACFGRASDFGMDGAVVKKGKECFEQALAKAENEIIRARVEKASLSLHALQIEPLFRQKDPKLKLTDQELEALRPEAEKFLELCRRYGVTLVAEKFPLADAEAVLQEVYGGKLKKP